MTSLTWDDLDRCETPDEIADLLRQHGIRGTQEDHTSCPLARATRWEVFNAVAELGEGMIRELTYAEKAFVRYFDRGRYPELEDKPGITPYLEGAEGGAAAR